jgi:hypothetical protein
VHEGSGGGGGGGGGGVLPHPSSKSADTTRQPGVSANAHESPPSLVPHMVGYAVSPDKTQAKDSDEDRTTLRAVLVGMLREADR